jgi:hypothetical protein
MGKINNPVELLQKSRSLRIVMIAIATEQRSRNREPNGLFVGFSF